MCKVENEITGNKRYNTKPLYNFLKLGKRKATVTSHIKEETWREYFEDLYKEAEIRQQRDRT